VAYDQILAGRIRELVGGGKDVTEQTMFGGLAFLVGGNMAVAASGQGGLLVRVDPDASDELLATSSATPMEMRGRSMAGWLRVGASDVETDSELALWVQRGVDYARTLPRKRQAADR
jgi:TfoX/Sxy family transcriptional regulator of competence genes